MNVKLVLILILLFLILLLLFYNINLESNIVILLGIIIILLINDLIKRSEYFQASIPENMFIRTNNNIDSLQTARLSELNSLLHLVQTLNANQQETQLETYMENNYPSIEVSNSCIRNQNINNQASSSSPSPSPVSNSRSNTSGASPGQISGIVDNAHNPNSNSNPNPNTST